MPLWLRHILTCLTVAAGCFASERADAAFLPPQLESTSIGGPAETGDSPAEAPRPERVDAAASASMTGVGLGTTSGGPVGQVLCGGDRVSCQLPLFVSRLKHARERVELSQGFLLDILRPPRV